MPNDAVTAPETARGFAPAAAPPTTPAPDSLGVDRAFALQLARMPKK